MEYLEFFGYMILAAGLGAILGWQREANGKAAGIRTHALVTIGSALFTMISTNGFESGEPSRVAAQILTGIGFIGAGAIMQKEDTVKGLTTASGLWAATAVGMAIGVEWVVEAVIATALIFLILFWKDKKISIKGNN